jgi:GalNAc5-diNAcBac-PP-undecaprenol beta-1,3-glucosyltransferase
MPDYSVLIPTHEHGALLDVTLDSVRAQTAASLEVLVVGDGAGEDTAEVVAAHARADDRVRWFPFPKGPRHGELHRHAVLTEHARGRAVLYCSDDDLWLPDHAERLLPLLGEADFAHALSTWINVDGVVQATFIDLATPHGRAAVLDGRRTPGLTVGAHTMDAYRRLPFGWRTTPAGAATDSHMWRQFLAEDWVRAASGRVPTVVHLPTPQRRSWTAEQRLAELGRYAAAIADPAWRLAHVEALLDKCIEEDVWFAGQVEHLEAWGHELDAQLRTENARLRELEAAAASWVWRLRERALNGRAAPIVRRLARR